MSLHVYSPLKYQVLSSVLVFAIPVKRDIQILIYFFPFSDLAM